MNWRWKQLATVAAVAAGLLTASFPAGAAPAGGLRPAVPGADAVPASWMFAGQNLADTRDQSQEHTLSPATVGSLAPKWVDDLHGTPSATPTVANGAVYVPDWGGYLNAIDAATGKILWSTPVAGYDGVKGAVSRTSPAIDLGELIIGDQTGAHIMAVDRMTGKLLWKRQVSAHPLAVITGNPVVFANTVYVGVSSLEEGAAENPNYKCCTFRGSVVALNAQTGKIQWKTYTVPANGGVPGGYSGGAVWDTPAVSPTYGLLYVGTGNNYSVPAAAATCQENALANNTSDMNCTAPDDYFESVLALNLRTGRIVWAHKVSGYDAWTAACIGLPAGVTWCPSPEGPDYDFGGSGPNLYTLQTPHGPKRVVGIGQKSGIYWAYDARTGKPLWNTLVGPGSALGGIEWGTATDGKRIYVAIANAYHESYKTPAGQTTNGGSIAALDPATGKILWQTPDPNGAMDLGAVAVANGVVYAGSMDSAGHMYALDAKSGHILWSFASGASVQSGAAIVGGTVFWGAGYGHFGIGTLSTKFYAFTLNGR